MTNFTDLASEIKSDVPQADTLLVVRAIRRTARRFCERTRVLEATTNPYIDIVADTSTYTLPAVANREIVGIKRGGVWWGVAAATDKRELFPKSADELDDAANEPDSYRLPADNHEPSTISVARIVTPWRELKDAEPVFFFQPLPTTIRLVPIPNTAYTAKLAVTYHLKPSRTATEIDDFIVDQWYETLVKGARGDLLVTKGKPWTDIREGEKNLSEFEVELGEIVSARVSGFTSQDDGVGQVRAWP